MLLSAAKTVFLIVHSILKPRRWLDYVLKLLMVLAVHYQLADNTMPIPATLS